MNNTKLNVYKVLCKVLVVWRCQGACKIEEIFSDEKLSVEEVTYLFINDYYNFKAETSCVC